MSAPESLLEKVAASMAVGAASLSSKDSILSQASASFALRPSGRRPTTIPTGFDPLAAALFEGVVEAAFLVATADGMFDPAERETFAVVMQSACKQRVNVVELQALVDDLAEQLEEDGTARRVEVVSKMLQNPEHKREVLRIAALMALASGGVESTERTILEQLCTSFALADSVVDEVIAEARAAVEG
jgi:tellurite resistance protein